LIGLAAGTELADQIAEGAVGQAKLACDVRQRASFQEEGTQGFIVPLLGLLGLAEELLAAQIVHGWSSQVSLHFRPERWGKW
jgi:hypothetical protein